MTFTRSRRVRNPLEKHSKVGELPRRLRRRHWPIFLEALEDKGWDTLLEQRMQGATADKVLLGGLQVELQTHRERSPLRKGD